MREEQRDVPRADLLVGEPRPVDEAVLPLELIRQPCERAEQVRLVLREQLAYRLAVLPGEVQADQLRADVPLLLEPVRVDAVRLAIGRVVRDRRFERRVTRIGQRPNVPRRTNWPRPCFFLATHWSFSTTRSPRESTCDGVPMTFLPSNGE